MALITPPTADEIYAEAGHNPNTGLGPQHFGLTTDEQVLAMIELEITPTIQRRANSKADVASYPYDFPFSTDVQKLAHPNYDESQIAEAIENQEGGFQDAIRQHAAATLLERIQTTNEFWVQRAARLEAKGDGSLESAAESVRSTVARTQQGQENGAARFGLITIDVEPTTIRDELSGLGYLGFPPFV